MADTSDNSHRMPRLNWRMFPWLKGSAERPEPTPAEFQAEPPLQESDEPPASSPAECPEDFPPLSLLKIGDTVQIDRSPAEQDEWTGEDFARLFLLWITHAHPTTRNSWVSSFDIELEYFDRFQAAAGCHALEAGSLLRGLGKVLGKTGKRERRYMDGTGKERFKAEYKIPRAVSNVVELDAAKRERA